MIVDHEAISAARAENSREGLTMLWVICLVYWGLGIGGYRLAVLAEAVVLRYSADTKEKI